MLDNNFTNDIKRLARDIKKPEGGNDFPTALVRYAVLESTYNIAPGSFAGSLIFAGSDAKVINVPFLSGARIPAHGSTVALLEFKSTESSQYIILGNVSTNVEITEPMANIRTKRIPFVVGINTAHTTNIFHNIAELTPASIHNCIVWVKGGSSEARPAGKCAFVDSNYVAIAIEAGYVGRNAMAILSYYETPVSPW